MNRSYDDLTQIVQVGGSIHINATDFPKAQLEMLAAHTKNAGGHITMRGMDQFSLSDVISICAHGKGHITLLD